MSDQKVNTKPKQRRYDVVGRNADVDLAKYGAVVHGRMIIDYAKLQREEPHLYQQIVDHEQAVNGHQDRPYTTSEPWWHNFPKKVLTYTVLFCTIVFRKTK